MPKTGNRLGNRQSNRDDYTSLIIYNFFFFILFAYINQSKLDGTYSSGYDNQKGRKRTCNDV